MDVRGKSAPKWLFYLTVVATSLASVATSQLEWQVWDTAEGPALLIDSTRNSDARPMTVHALGEFELLTLGNIEVTGELLYDVPEDQPVTVQIQLVSGSPSADVSAGEAEFTLRGSGTEPIFLYSWAFDHCMSAPCTEDLELTMTTREPLQQGNVKLAWSVSAILRGDGDEAPAGADVEIVINE